MSSFYQNQSLGVSGGQYLANYLGEILMVYNKGLINMKRLETIMSMPISQPRYRLFLLNPDETIDTEIDSEDIIIDTGNYSENYQNGQRKNVNISLININGRYTPSINTIWVHNRFRFDVGIEYQGDVYWFPRGIYILGNPVAINNNSDKQITLTLVDKFSILEGKMGTLSSTYEIPVGSEIENVIKNILTLDNGSGYPIDLKPIIYDQNFKGLTMPYTLSKDAGSTLADLIKDIGTILNAEYFYNSVGNLCFISVNETIDDSKKSTLWDYNTDNSEYLNSTATYDFENVVNEIQIVGDGVNNDIVSAIARNENNESPICIQIIGRRIDYINDSNITNDTLAQYRANYELRKKGILSTTINIEVSFNPLLFVNNLITIDDEYYGYKRSKFIIQSISYNIGVDNKMVLTCSNVQNFSF